MVNVKISLEALLLELNRVKNTLLPTKISYLVAERTQASDLVLNGLINIHFVSADTKDKEWVVHGKMAPNGNSHIVMVSNKDNSIVVPFIWTAITPDIKRVGFVHFYAYLKANVLAEVKGRQEELARDGTGLLDKSYKEYQDYKSSTSKFTSDIETRNYLSTVQTAYDSVFKPKNKSIWTKLSEMIGF